MLYCLESSHLLLQLSIYIISLMTYVSFLQINFKFLRENDLPYAFSIVSKFCILITSDVKSSNGSVKTNKTKQKCVIQTLVQLK